jgi:hypothetical protein
MAEDRYPQPPPHKFTEPIDTVIKRSQVPIFLEEFEPQLKDGSFSIDEKIKRLKIYKQFETLEIILEDIDRNWYWLSASYGVGNQLPKTT